jgi:glycosyltransferase involved in cell wall biosynthesis
VVEVPEKAAGFDQRHGLAFLGGFTHGPNPEAMEYFVREVMPLLRERLPDIVLKIYGSDIPDRIQLLAAEDVVIEGWVADVAQVYANCRVFIAPLRSGAGLKGKVVGAFAHGAPCVLSPIAAEGTGIRDGHEALIAETPHQWAESIVGLHENREMWTRLHDAARRYAASEFNFSKGQRLMQTALEAVDIYATPDDSVLKHG